MKKLIRYLNQPLPATDKPWQVVLTVAVLVLFVLGIFQPFGIDTIKENKFIILIGFMLVSAAGAAVVVYIFPLLFKRFYSDNWTIGKNLINIFLNVVVISIGNTLFSFFVMENNTSFNWAYFLTSLLFYSIVTFLVGIIPAIVIIFLQRDYALKRNLKEVRELNLKLSAQQNQARDSFTSNPVTLSGNTKDSLALHPEQILFLEAYGNYVKVNYMDNDSNRQKLLRTTIRQMEEELTGYDYILRCHRAFLVNTRQISNIKGNSQGYRLVLNHHTEEIPVSRAYAKAFKEYLA